MTCTLDPNKNKLFFLWVHKTPYEKSELLAVNRIIPPVIILISKKQALQKDQVFTKEVQIVYV